MHWPHIADISGSPPMGSRLEEGDVHLPALSLLSMGNFTFTGVIETSVLDSIGFKT